MNLIQVSLWQLSIVGSYGVQQLGLAGFVRRHETLELELNSNKQTQGLSIRHASSCIKPGRLSRPGRSASLKHTCESAEDTCIVEEFTLLICERNRECRYTIGKTLESFDAVFR
jgi:hypothetical protein